MMPKKPMKSTGKVAPSKVRKPSKMSSTGSKNMASKYGEKPPVIGPVTKRDARKIDIVTKKADKKMITPLTKSGNEAMQNKLKQNRKKALGYVGGFVGTVAAGIDSMIQDRKRMKRYTEEQKAQGATSVTHPGYSKLKKMYKNDKKSTK